jgi:uncharacterized protein (DUF2249 family)
MNGVKTIDVRGLEHTQRENLIFPGLEEIKDNETLRIVLEFNPLPLVYMLKARDEFEILHEKEGPHEWILNVRRIAPGKDKNEYFKELLKELKQDQVSEEAKEKARKLLQTVDAKTLGIMEQELIMEGVSHDEIRKSLCDIHLEVLRDSLVSKRIKVPAPHPVHTFMQEHEVILGSLNDLDALVGRLKEKNSFESTAQDREKLKDIAHHLVEAESHHQREEDVLFPELEKHDIVEPPQIFRIDHVEFRKRKQELYQLAHNSQDYDFQEFKTKVIELDLRPIMPFERHELIFQKWDSLKPGQTLKIINDHDPKPLHYQFEAEYTNQYEWEYEQEGPKDWVVKIKKITSKSGT